MSEYRIVGALEVGSLYDERLFGEAVELIGRGEVIAFHILGVCGMLGDGSQESTWEAIDRIKGGQKVRAGMLHHARVRDMNIIDIDRIGHPGLQRLFRDDPSALASIVGARAHILYPVLPEAVARVPEMMLSRHADGYGQFQVFESHGTSLESLVDAAHDAGVEFPVVTSLNKMHAGSITDIDTGIDFAAASGRIKKFLIGDQSGRVGSFGVFHAGDAVALRQGPELQDVIDTLSQYST